ncbi:UNVERIFIED_CONTAM: hypothetical protein Slati_3151400 [Sesamum latifolium]|uniref:Uncharacterized protein n=1 Tax=Sesamum latifolium TaxID=2727402 RepID=A0AAW2UUZ0_9LAMI
MARLSHSVRLARKEVGPPPAVALVQGVRGSPYEVVTTLGVGVTLLHSLVFHGQCPLLNIPSSRPDLHYEC